MKYLLLLLTLISCGSQEVQLKAPEEDLISGESYSYIIVRIEHIKEIKEQCTNLYPEYEFDMFNQQEVQERDKLIAECFFSNTSIDLGSLDKLKSEVCDKPVDQQTEYEKVICEALQ